ncbi:hypothetical protein [Marinospirillum perlucidum]|uniref:hypothetical protein n=1 Tax=Marinospirillum perlucidum TaxID=1982602 RepID=UPI000DF2AA7B|nr:hypothetical protein [Marinospirillum perlucidum]
MNSPLSTRQSGFVFLPLLLLTLLSLLLVQQASQDLFQTQRNHQLLLYQNCQQLIEQLEMETASECPPCPLPGGCHAED